MIRLQDPDTRQYLHLDAKQTTPTPHLAWLGTRKQALRLARRAAGNGDAFNFAVIPRGIYDQTTLHPDRIHE
ncbi:hypothetical protein J4E08_22285 [Sagittula sp. NFXS13]|uniref:hypothetical protein n=1 Tax=Sagittula sp. NFXS13 TaxID=2819095 RepID=UPI0032DFF338